MSKKPAVPVRPVLPLLDDEPTVRELTLRELTAALLGGIFSAVRQNKLASTLAVIVTIAGAFLAFSIRYDERPEYRQLILPDIQRAETNFLNTLDNAEHAPTESWRLQYFLAAHRRASEVLRVSKSRQPRTEDGMAAHAALIRYYELVNESIAIIRTEMSINEKMDYWSEWQRQRALLEPIRQSWLKWVNES